MLWKCGSVNSLSLWKGNSRFKALCTRRATSAVPGGVAVLASPRGARVQSRERGADISLGPFHAAVCTCVIRCVRACIAHDPLWLQDTRISFSDEPGLKGHRAQKVSAEVPLSFPFLRGPVASWALSFVLRGSEVVCPPALSFVFPSLDLFFCHCPVGARGC